MKTLLIQEEETQVRQAPAPQTLVSATDVTRRYGVDGDICVKALRGVSLDVGGGKLTAVMGPSGSGKSTLMHILAGLDRPNEGAVTIAGTDITELDDTELTKLRREHIGFIFQFFNLLPMLTRGGERHPPDQARRREARPRVGRRADEQGRPVRSSLAPPVRAVGRPAAAGRDRARARLEADGHVRRRADRQPGLDDERRDPRAAPRLGDEPRPDDRHGHARRACGRDRRPRPFPRRRPDRQGHRAVVRTRHHRRDGGGERPDDGRHAPGPLRPQDPQPPHRVRRRSRRRDDQRHLRPHGHLPEGVRQHLQRVVRRYRRRRQRQAAPRVLLERARARRRQRPRRDPCAARRRGSGRRHLRPPVELESRAARRHRRQEDRRQRRRAHVRGGARHRASPLLAPEPRPRESGHKVPTRS